MVAKFHGTHHMGVEPKIAIPQSGWFIMETPIKMDDLGVPLFLETPIWKKMDGGNGYSPP